MSTNTATTTEDSTNTTTTTTSTITTTITEHKSGLSWENDPQLNKYIDAIIKHQKHQKHQKLQQNKKTAQNALEQRIKQKVEHLMVSNFPNILCMANIPNTESSLNDCIELIYQS